MYMEQLELSPTPIAEDCTQVGTPEAYKFGALECRVFVEQLRRVFGDEPTGSYFKIASNSHEFGTYYEVVIRFDEDNKAASKYAYKIEGKLPQYWDEEAKSELRERNYPIQFKQ
jgi:hypothetical protein